MKFKCGFGEEPYSSEQTIPMVADLHALYEQTHRSPLDLVIGNSGAWCMHIRVEDSVLVPDADPPVTRRAGASPKVTSDTAAASAGAKAALAAVHEKSQQPGDSPANLARFEPYTAELKDGVWHVQGTAPPKRARTASPREIAGRSSA